MASMHSSTKVSLRIDFLAARFVKGGQIMLSRRCSRLDTWQKLSGEYFFEKRKNNA